MFTLNHGFLYTMKIQSEDFDFHGWRSTVLTSCQQDGSADLQQVPERPHCTELKTFDRLRGTSHNDLLYHPSKSPRMDCMQGPPISPSVPVRSPRSGVSVAAALTACVFLVASATTP